MWGISFVPDKAGNRFETNACLNNRSVGGYSDENRTAMGQCVGPSHVTIETTLSLRDASGKFLMQKAALPFRGEGSVSAYGADLKFERSCDGGDIHYD